MPIAVLRMLFLATILALSSGGRAFSAPACGPSSFARTPSADELAAVYPNKARADGLPGRAVLRCTVRPDGTLADCAVESEDPAGAGFGAAALAIAPKIQATPPCPGAPETLPGGARMPIRFELPKEPPLRTPVFSKTPREYAATAPLGPYWPQWALRRGVGGKAALDCQVDEANHLSHCVIAEETPAHTGFGDAMLLMANRGLVTAAPLVPGAPAPADGIWRFRIVLSPHRL